MTDTNNRQEEGVLEKIVLPVGAIIGAGLAIGSYIGHETGHHVGGVITGLISGMIIAETYLCSLEDSYGNDTPEM